MLYKREDIIGNGKYSAVYRGRDLETNQIIAIKQVFIENERDPLLIILNREVDIMKELSHPCIIKYISHECRLNLFSISLEYLPNGSLASLKQRGISLLIVS